MRRIVDASIPVFCAIATVPVYSQIIDLPMSLQRSIGEAFGIVWCVVVATAMLAVCLGIWFRPSRPSLALKLEWPALIVAGLISAIFGVAIFAVAGLTGWTAAWFVWAIGAHCTTRYFELALLRLAAKRAARDAAKEAARQAAAQVAA